MCPFIFCTRGLTAEQVLDTVLEALAEGEKKTGVMVRIILCSLKTNPGEADNERSMIGAYMIMSICNSVFHIHCVHDFHSGSR